MPISTYLYSVVGGPFDIFHPEEADKDVNVPMRLLCRKSLASDCANIKDDWFRVTKHGIHYYEEVFSTKYPFDKID